MSGAGRSQKKHQKEVKRKKLQKQRSAVASQTHRIPPREVRNALMEANELTQEGQLDEAEKVLLSEQRHRRNSPELLEALMDLYQRTKDHLHLAETARQLVQLQPHDPEAQLIMAQGYMFCGRIAMAMIAYRAFLVKWSDHKYASKALAAVAVLEPELKRILTSFELTESELDLMALHERILHRIGISEFDAAIEDAKELLAVKPMMVSARNNLTLTLFQTYQMQEAVETVRETLQMFPDNRFAEASLGRMLFLSGQFEEAHEIARHISVAPADQQDAVAIQAEFLGLMGEDEEILRVAQHAENIPSMAPECRGVLNHYKAFALKRLGRDQEAVDCWKLSLKDYPQLTLAKENLAELKSGVHCHAPWPDHLGKWIPKRAMDEFIQFLTSEKSSQTLRVSEALNHWPHVGKLVPALLDRGDRAGREFALLLAKSLASEEMLNALESFATSNRGPDELRSQTLSFLKEKGRLNEGSIQFWSRGKWNSILVTTMEINQNPVPHNNPRVDYLIQQGYEAMQTGEFDVAEAHFRVALALDPEFLSAQFNVAAAMMMKSDPEAKAAAKKIIKEIHQRCPDYAFARIAMAQFSIANSRLDEAQELLKPFMMKTQWHVSEYKAYALAQVELSIARRDFVAARNSIKLLEQFQDGDARINQLEERIAKAELRDRGPMMRRKF
ncbi:MAG: tetratricopeptide repeat protein [Planctomycetaceae bacterium]